MVAALNGERVARVDPRNGLQTKILRGDGFSSAVDVAFDLDGSILVVVNVEAGGELVRVDRLTGASTPVPGADFHKPVGVAVGPDGAIWVLEDRHGVGPSVVRFDPVTKQRTLLTSQGLLRGPFRVALEAGGSMVVSVPDVSGGNGQLIRVEGTSGAQSVLAEGQLLVEPFGVAVLRR